MKRRRTAALGVVCAAGFIAAGVVSVFADEKLAQRPPESLLHHEALLADDALLAECVLSTFTPPPSGWAARESVNIFERGEPHDSPADAGPASIDPCHPCRTGTVNLKCKISVTCLDQPDASESFKDLPCAVECVVGNIQSTTPDPDCNDLCDQVCPTSARSDCRCRVDNYH